MTTMEEAQRGRAAFPIVVSADDTYPGHGNVDALQDVNSGWALLDRYALTADTDTPEHGSVTQRGMTVTANANTGYYASGYTVTPEGAATVLQNGNTFRISALRQDCKVTIHFAAKTPAARALLRAGRRDGSRMSPVISAIRSHSRSRRARPRLTHRIITSSAGRPSRSRPRP